MKHEARTYILSHFEIDKASSFSKKIGNCLHAGETCFKKKNNTLLSEEDEEVFKHMDLGQTTRIHLDGQGFSYIVLRWENDSSG